MNSKERMLCAISHQEPDQAPMGEWEFGWELVYPVLGRKSLYPYTLDTIKAYWDGRRNDVINAWKNDLVEVTLKLEWDAVLVHLVIDENTTIEVPEPAGEENTWFDSSGNKLYYSHETDRMCIIEKTPDPPANPVPAPTPAQGEPTESELEVVRHVVKELGDTHFIFAAPFRTHPRIRFGDATSGGQVEGWVKLYEDPEAFLEKRIKAVRNPELKRSIEFTKNQGIDGIAFGWDYGTNNGPFMAPEMFRDYILPYLAEYVSLVHDQGLVFMHHACGNNQKLMDMIVEAGVDVYQSIQPEMDIIAMKKRYGKNITLWGGVSSGDLITSNPEAIRRESEKFLKECMPGGGYVFATSHSVMPGIKYENYLAMLEARREFGNY